MRYDYNFDNKKNDNKKIILLLITIIIVVIVFTSFFFRGSDNKIVGGISKVILFPINSVYDFGTKVFDGSKNYFSDKKKTNDENIKLLAENENLKYQILETQKISDENKSLKEMLNIKKEFQHFEIKLAKIVYREHDNWSQTFRINIGSNDGIKINQAVVHQSGLVGFISNVTDDTSTVTSILDPSASVSVNISTINEPAVLQGDLTLKSSNKLKLVFIPLDAQVSIADILYTSGLGFNYPSSIPVGKIIEVVNGKNDMNRYAIVEPNVNIRTISEIGVIIN
jgi:rod shape-determining protein MreC